MKIRELYIDGFGAWQGLHLKQLQPGLNVIYGPNEAGKTTLLEFIRSMFYGFSVERRRRYLPPVRGAHGGGWMLVDTPQDSFQLWRRDDMADGITSPGQIAIRTLDGELCPAQRLTELLSAVDEPTFEHVFAVGLGEIQELGTLDDTAAAEQLYNLTTGLDRVSLAEVIGELSSARGRLLNVHDGDGQIPRLLAERSRLRSEIDELSTLTPRYAQLVGERRQLEERAGELDNEIEELKHQLRLWDAAQLLRDQWHKRAALDSQLAGCDGAVEISTTALARLERYKTSIRRRRARLRKLYALRKELRVQVRKLPLNRSLLDQAARIHALADQQPWIAGLERKAGELDKERREVEREIDRRSSTIGLGQQISAEVLRGVSRRSTAPLRTLARSLRDSRRVLDEARRQLPHGADAAPPAETRKIVEPTSDLIQAAEAAGQKVSLLRRRVQINQRLEQMAAHQQELEEQSGELAERQLLPLPLVLVLGTVFVLGVVLVLAGWWLSFGWMVSVLGAASIIGSIAMKYYLERSADDQLDSCDRQLGSLRQQMEQLKQERKQLDSQIPSGGGPLLARLEAAEAELARLEELLPVEAQRAVAAQDHAAATGQVKRAEAAYHENRRRWRQTLEAAGWPSRLSPKQVSLIVRRSGQLRALYQREAQLTADHEQTVAALGACLERIRQLLADVELMPSGDNASALLAQLRQELAAQEAQLRRRKLLVRRDRVYRRYQVRQRRYGRRLVAARNRLLQQWGVVDESDFRARLAENERLAKLRAERETLQREIALALGGEFTEVEVQQAVHGIPEEQMRERRGHIAQVLQEKQAALRTSFEKGGEIQHELQLLKDDHRIALRQLELGQIEARLAAAVDRWKTLATTSFMLAAVRELYERERQPQTLQDASRYLRQLTSGRYQRVWTPLGEDLLLVDNSQGEAMRIENLSRGTREQLFLSLRLALVASYARRGAALPMVLDDVLVNFDTQRAEAAAALLRDFAAEGYQLLVFTCHEHLAEMFRGLEVSVRQLPSRQAPGVVEELPPLARKKARRKLAPEPTPMIVLEPVAEPLTVPAKDTEPVAKPIVEPQLIPAVEFLEDPYPVLSHYVLTPPTIVQLVETPLVRCEIPVPNEEPKFPWATHRRRRLRRAKRDAREAMFSRLDGLIPYNEEPDDSTWYYVDVPWPQADTGVIELPPQAESRKEVEPPQPEEPWVWIGGHWLGEGGEEFDGEFAERPQPVTRFAKPAIAPSTNGQAESSRRRRSKRPTSPGDANAA